MAKIVSAGQKWKQPNKEYLHYDWTFDSNLCMTGGQGGDISARKRILFFSSFDQVTNC